MNLGVSEFSKFTLSQIMKLGQGRPSSGRGELENCLTAEALPCVSLTQRCREGALFFLSYVTRWKTADLRVRHLGLNRDAGPNELCDPRHVIRLF